MGETKKTTDWLGREKEEHFDDSGEKVGETRFTSDWLGNRVQEHFDSENEKTGETRAGHDWLGRDRAEHFDNERNRVGTSRDEEDWLGRDVQRHYDASREKVGETRHKEDWVGRPYKEHNGEYFKAGSSREVHDSNSIRYESYHASTETRSPAPPNGYRWVLVAFVLVALLVIVKVTLPRITSQQSTPPSQSVESPDGTPDPSGPKIKRDVRHVPPAIRNTLDHDYPGWFFPEVPEEDLNECRQPNAQFQPGFVWGDFDGDGAKDYGLAVQQGQKLYTLAFLARGNGFEKVALEPSGWEILGVEPSGSTLPHVGVGASGTLEEEQPVALSRDALIGIACGKSAVAYTFEDGKFQHFFIQD